MLKWGLVAVAVVLAALPALAAEEPQQARIRGVAKVQANGDVELRYEFTLSELLYTIVRKQITHSKLLLRELGTESDLFDLKDPKIEYDDARRRVTVTARSQGMARNRGRDWLIEFLEPDQVEAADTDPEAITLLVVRPPEFGVLIIITVRFEFPQGTTHIRLDPARGGLLFEMPPAPSQPQGNVDVDMQVDVPSRIMSCLYKIFGRTKLRILWAARALFRNRGTAAVRDLRVRFRIPEYTEWSGWARTAFVYPTQTVVEPFFPIMAQKICELRSATRANIEVEWAYRTPDGKLVEENATRPITILGLNEALLASLPPEECKTWYESSDNALLIAATFVSHTDPIVQQFAGMAAKMAGGAGAAMDATSALRVMNAVYDLMAHNQIRSEAPPWLWKQGAVQYVKFGRDVLQSRMGTSLDLAILYASTCQSLGLEPVLFFLPNHVVPIIKLPGGGGQAVETTGVAGASQGRPIAFALACMQGAQRAQLALAEGQFWFADIQKLRLAGALTPELPALPPSTLKDWGIKAPEGLLPTPPPAAGRLAKTLADAQGVSTLSLPDDWVVQDQGGIQGACDPLQRALCSVTAIPKVAQSLDQFEQFMVGNWQKSVPEWKQLNRTAMSIGGRQAVFIEASGKPMGNEMAAHYYLVLTDRHQLLLVLLCKLDELAQWRDIFRQIVGTWRIP